MWPKQLSIRFTGPIASLGKKPLLDHAGNLNQLEPFYDIQEIKIVQATNTIDLPGVLALDLNLSN